MKASRSRISGRSQLAGTSVDGLGGGQPVACRPATHSERSLRIGTRAPASMNNILPFKNAHQSVRDCTQTAHNPECPVAPIEVTGVEFATGADVERLLPPYETLPYDFTNGTSPWTCLARHILEQGISTNHEFAAHPDIDVRLALRHIGAALQANAPDHHKIAGIAYLLSRWFRFARVGNLTVVGKDAT